MEMHDTLSKQKLKGVGSNRSLRLPGVWTGTDLVLTTLYELSTTG